MHRTSMLFLAALLFMACTDVVTSSVHVVEAHDRLMRAPTMTDIGTPPGSLVFEGNSRGHAINDAGDVTGWFEVFREVDGDTVSVSQAYLWNEHHGWIELGTLDPEERFANALGINNRADVVGFSDISGSPAVHAFLWSRRGGMV